MSEKWEFMQDIVDVYQNCGWGGGVIPPLPPPLYASVYTCTKKYFVELAGEHSLHFHTPNSPRGLLVQAERYILAYTQTQRKKGKNQKEEKILKKERKGEREVEGEGESCSKIGLREMRYERERER